MTSLAPRNKRWARLSRAQRLNLNGYLLSAPSLAVITVIILIPFLSVIVFAFAEFRLIDIQSLTPFNIRWTLDNFSDALRSERFWGALWTTVVYSVLTTIGVVGAGVLVGLALRRPFRGRGVVRALLLIPYVLPIISAATIWRTMLNPQYGIVNAVGTEFLGWDRPIAFLTSSSMPVAGIPVPVTLLVVIAFEIWKSTPLAFLFITARLQSVPHELEEAAAIDGANSRQVLSKIILPQLRGVILLLVLLRFIWSFQSFNDIYLLTYGAGGTEVMAVKVFTQLINRADVGSAAAYGLLMSAILAVFAVGWFLVMRRKEEM